MTIDATSPQPYGSPKDLFTAAAAKHLYDQECALHDAHGSGVATWISRAEQRLHTAILFYEAAAIRAPSRPGAPAGSPLHSPPSPGAGRYREDYG